MTNTYETTDQKISVTMTFHNKIYTARTWIGSEVFFVKTFPNKKQALTHILTTVGHTQAA